MDDKGNNMNDPMHGSDPQTEQDQDRIDAYAMAQLKTAQTLLTIAVIGGPVSLILGGVLLSGIALVCAIVGYTKIKKVMDMPTSSKAISDSLRRQSLICIVVCSAALVINAAFFVQMVNLYMEYIVNGDVQGLMDAMYGPDASSASSASSDASSASGNGSSGSGSASGNGSGSGSGNGSVWDK